MSKSILDYILKRAVEPSTYSGLAALLAGAHFTVSNDLLTAITGALIAIAGMVGIFLKEKGLA